MVFLSSFSFGQYLDEHEWTTLSGYVSSGNNQEFEKFLTQKEFLKAEEANEKYTFYSWKKTDHFFYGVRVNKKSGQVTYMTNDQNYVLKLLSKFISEYTRVTSDQQGQRSVTHIFESPTATIAVKLDITENQGTHLLFAKTKS